MMTLDSPADLAEVQNPFNNPRAIADSLAAASARGEGQKKDRSVSVSSPAEIGSLQAEDTPVEQQQQDESFYHALLEIVKTEDGYTEDLTDLVEVRPALPFPSARGV